MRPMHVKRSDIQAKATEIETAVSETKESAQDTAVLVGVAVVVIVLLAFFFGRRKGKKGNKAVVEVYRVS